MNTAKSCTFQGQMCDGRPLNTAEHVLTLAFYKTKTNLSSDCETVCAISDPVLGQQAVAELLMPALSDSTYSTTEYFSEEAIFSSSLEHTSTQHMH